MPDSTFAQSDVDATGEPRPDVAGSRAPKVVVYPFDRYQILVELTETGQFLGIAEVRVNKDFRRYMDRISSGPQHNAEKFYDKE